MPDVEPLTAEEIITIRKALRHRAKFITTFWGALATLVAGAVFAIFFDL
jgi:hypothetical protein